MKSLLTHLLAAAIGMLLVIAGSRIAGHHNSSENTLGTAQEREIGPTNPGPLVQSRARSRNVEAKLDEMEFSRRITEADLESWVASKQSDSLGEALVMVGLLTENSDLIHQGIEADPHNPHLLLIGATQHSFSAEERLALSKRLLEADPDNALGAFLSAALLLDAGKSDEAVQMLRSSTERFSMEDYRMDTQLMMEEAYIAAGLSRSTAKIRSAGELSLPYLSEFGALASSLIDMETDLRPEESSELRSLTVLMGQRMATQSSSGTMIERLAGIAVQEATLSGLPADAPSPYEGLSVGQARDSLDHERQRLREAVRSFGDASDLLSHDPDLYSRYIDRFRVMGELEALEWLSSETESAR